jgi:hypothetical protein
VAAVATGAEAEPVVEAEVVPVSEEAAGRPQEVAAGTARWVPRRAVVAGNGAPRWAPPVGWGAESGASQDRPAEAEEVAVLPCRANQAARGVAAASSPVQFCLIGTTWRVDVAFTYVGGG